MQFVTSLLKTKGLKKHTFQKSAHARSTLTGLQHNRPSSNVTLLPCSRHKGQAFWTVKNSPLQECTATYDCAAISFLMHWLLSGRSQSASCRLACHACGVGSTWNNAKTQSENFLNSLKKKFSFIYTKLGINAESCFYPWSNPPSPFCPALTFEDSGHIMHRCYGRHSSCNCKMGK